MSEDKKWSLVIGRTSFPTPQALTAGPNKLGNIQPGLLQNTVAAIKVEPLSRVTTARVRESYNLRFKVTDSYSNTPHADLADLGVLVFLAPGIWQKREWARPLGDGVYEMTFVPPQAGVYYVFFQCPSLNVRFNQTTSLTLQAISNDDVPKANQR